MIAYLLRTLVRLVLVLIGFLFLLFVVLVFDVASIEGFREFVDLQMWKELFYDPYGEWWERWAIWTVGIR